VTNTDDALREYVSLRRNLGFNSGLTHTFSQPSQIAACW
jgi:hypothetical protein